MLHQYNKFNNTATRHSLKGSALAQKIMKVGKVALVYPLRHPLKFAV